MTVRFCPYCLMDTPRNVEGWTPVFHTSTDYEADLVRDRLGDAGIDAVVYTQRDHSFNLSVGSLAQVHVLVPPDRAAEAHELLAFTPSDADLDAASAAADPISFDVPDDVHAAEQAHLTTREPSRTPPGGPALG